MAYTSKDVVFIARNERETIANILVYLKPKKEFVICSNFTQKGEEIVWDWGHYYNDFKSAVMDFYKEDFNMDYMLKYNYDILEDLRYKETTTESETRAIDNILDLIKYIDKNKEM